MSVLSGYSVTIRHSLYGNTFKCTFNHPVIRSCHTLRNNTNFPKRINNSRPPTIRIGGIVNSIESSRAFHDYRQYTKTESHSSSPAIVPTAKVKDRITLFRAGEEDTQSIPSFEELRPSLDSIVQHAKSDENKEKSSFIWLDVTNPSINEIKEISHAFGLHRLTVEDVVEAEMREKVEEYDSVSVPLNVSKRLYEADL